MSTDPMQTHGAVSWIEYQGQDPEAAQAFYGKVLGWTIAPMPMQDGSPYTGIMLGEQPIGGFAHEAAPASAWLTYITVDDTNARTRAAAEAGATIVTEPFDIPGVGRMSVIQDPFGATLALITYEQKEG
ncbi:MAG: VOC family protein [Acidobacteriota bacterium]